MNLLSAAALLALLPQGSPHTLDDACTAFDVEAYDLQLAVQPRTRTLDGAVEITAVALADGLATVPLELYDLHDVLAVESDTGRDMEYERVENGLVVRLPEPVDEGSRFAVRVRYRGRPEGGDFDGFHWAKTADGKPWIGTSCQGLGAHYWFPCKASYFHPEDKPSRVSMAITCPADLQGVSNGRLVEVRDGAPDWYAPEKGEWKTYRWRHDYPLETYAVTLNVAPYVVVEQELDVPGLDDPVPFLYYVLPDDAEKAALQFQQVPELVRIYSEAFGPFPFPESKFGLVETSFWGMEHSTAVAYGSSFPAWCAENHVADSYSGRNRWFDYILVHEVAHEWWGNGVSAADWGHFWIHEGFATYAEGVYVERTRSREDADRFFGETAARVPADRGSLYRGDHPDSGAAYGVLIYGKGACVLNTLRHYVGDDDAWWKSLREFNMEKRYGVATTEDFRAVLERNTGRDWKRFFDEWFHGEGTPALGVQVRTSGKKITVEVENERGSFLVPIDLSWDEDGQGKTRRLWVEPGEHELVVECEAKPRHVAVEHLDRVLGEHTVRVR